MLSVLGLSPYLKKNKREREFVKKLPRVCDELTTVSSETRRRTFDSDRDVRGRGDVRGRPTEGGHLGREANVIGDSPGGHTVS